MLSVCPSRSETRKPDSGKYMKVCRSGRFIQLNLIGSHFVIRMRITQLFSVGLQSDALINHFSSFILHWIQVWTVETNSLQLTSCSHEISCACRERTRRGSEDKWLFFFRCNLANRPTDVGNSTTFFLPWFRNIFLTNIWSLLSN